MAFGTPLLLPPVGSPNLSALEPATRPSLSRPAGPVIVALWRRSKPPITKGPRCHAFAVTARLGIFDPGSILRSTLTEENLWPERLDGHPRRDGKVSRLAAATFQSYSSHSLRRCWQPAV